MEVIIKTTNKANNAINITGLVLILLGFIVQSIPAKNDKKQEQINSSLETESNNTSNLSATSQISSSQPAQQYTNPSTNPQTQTYSERTQAAPESKEDFSSYLNNSISNSGNTDVSVTILENGNTTSSISSSIANIYRQNGYNSSTGLIRSSFINNSGFTELEDGNSDIVRKLNLSDHTDYLVIGRINFSYREGTVVSGTTICNASITVNIINAKSKSISHSFSISDINANGASHSQAKEKALQRLLENYSNQYSSL